MTEYAYDVDGNLDATTYPSGLKVKLERDVTTGEVRKVRTDDGTTTFAERVEWWPGGPARSFTFGNGETFSQSVTLRYEPRTIRSGPLSLDYTMTPAGDVSAPAPRPRVLTCHGHCQCQPARSRATGAPANAHRYPGQRPC